MAVTNTGIVLRTITGVNESDLFLDSESTSVATNTGIVERSLTGVNESDLWLDSESTSVVNNTGIVERPITGINESDPMFPDNTISNIINLAGNLIAALIEAFKTRVSSDGGTLDNEIGLDIEDFDDTASLTMLPNAYKDGTLYSILPEDGTGDFDVVRGSSATRVNAEGLIEDISVLSGELITSGNDTSNIIGLSDNQNISIQTSFLTIGKTYKLDFEIYDYIEGSIFLLRPTDLGVGTAVSANGTYSYTLLANASTSLIFRTDGLSTTLKLRGISVKEVIDATNIPRIDYTTGEGVVLLEPQSTNLVTYSEDFSDAYWTKQSGVTATYNTTETLSPDGTYNATKFVGNGTTGVFKTSISVSGVVSRSVYLKSVTGTTTATFKEPNTNVPSPITLTITNEWQRFEMIGDNGSSFQGLQIDDITSSGLYMWGAQAEALSHATSYIPTSGTIATRLADSVTGAGDATTFNSTEGVLYFEGAALADGSNTQVSLSDGTNNNGVKLRFDLTADRLTMFIRGNGGATASKTVSGTSQTDNNKIALVWNATNLRMWINGVEAGTIATNDLPTGLNTLNIANNTGAANFEGKVKDLRVYNTALTDAELLTLTTL